MANVNPNVFAPLGPSHIRCHILDFPFYGNVEDTFYQRSVPMTKPEIFTFSLSKSMLLHAIFLEAILPMGDTGNGVGTLSITKACDNEVLFKKDLNASNESDFLAPANNIKLSRPIKIDANRKYSILIQPNHDGNGWWETEAGMRKPSPITISDGIQLTIYGNENSTLIDHIDFEMN